MKEVGQLSFTIESYRDYSSPLISRRKLLFSSIRLLCGTVGPGTPNLLLYFFRRKVPNLEGQPPNL